VIQGQEPEVKYICIEGIKNFPLARTKKHIKRRIRLKKGGNLRRLRSKDLRLNTSA
jgi:hypothetical protein